MTEKRVSSNLQTHGMLKTKSMKTDKNAANNSDFLDESFYSQFDDILDENPGN